MKANMRPMMSEYLQQDPPRDTRQTSTSSRPQPSQVQRNIPHYEQNNLNSNTSQSTVTSSNPYPKRPGPFPTQESTPSSQSYSSPQQRRQVEEVTNPEEENVPQTSQAHSKDARINLYLFQTYRNERKGLQNNSQSDPKTQQI